MPARHLGECTTMYNWSNVLRNVICCLFKYYMPACVIKLLIGDTSLGLFVPKAGRDTWISGLCEPKVGELSGFQL